MRGTPSAIEFGALVRRLADAPTLSPGGRAALELLARRLWDALRDGHACVPLASLRRALAAARLAPADLDAAIAHARANAPWLLEFEHDRAWLRRMACLEQSVADALRALDAAQPLADADAVERWIGQQFGADAGGPDQAQRRAVRVALARRLLVLTGGPGTGKTHTLARIVHAVRALGGDPVVRVAAPTGKAAARLGEQLRARGIDGIDGIDPTTVHALLEIDRSGRPRRNASDPVEADLVLIDECSMLDLAMCARLLEALAPGARLVLAGDRDQLASVDAGAVFAELTDGAALPDALVTLTHNFRQRDALRLAAFAAAVRDGRDAEALAALGAPGLRHDAAAVDTPVVDETTPDAPAAAELGRRDPAAGPQAAVAEAVAGYRPLVEALARGAGDADLLARLGDYRLLTALRDGPTGAAALNRAIGAVLRRHAEAAGGASRSPAWRGRLLMVTANDREQRLWNGDVGIALGDGTVLFADAAGEGGARRVPFAALPAHEDAFAMTVHKSQGSEFDAVTLLPAPAGHALAVRELLYTGVTRARRRCMVHADVEAVVGALATPTRRDGALSLRLRAGGGPRVGAAG